MPSGGNGKKLTYEQVRVIRRMHREGEGSCSQLGRRFGVSKQTINNITQFKLYKMVK